MPNNLIIAMWSGPRNLSTALMRSFANRKDVTNVIDEPFYASYLKHTGKDHPMKKEVIQSQSSNIDDVKKLCNKIHEGITYQKHMTQHILDKDYEWINSLNNCFLIRHPQMVVKSFNTNFFYLIKVFKFSFSFLTSYRICFRIYNCNTCRVITAVF